MECGGEEEKAYVPNIVKIPLEVLKQKAEGGNEMYEVGHVYQYYCYDQGACGLVDRALHGL